MKKAELRHVAGRWHVVGAGFGHSAGFLTRNDAERCFVNEWKPNGWVLVDHAPECGCGPCLAGE